MSDPQPLISVVIISYNTAALVEHAIASVLAQTYRNFELIVVDDGSTDDTEARLSARTDLRYVKVANGGIGWARNHGVAAARGEWFAFLDSDDRWYPDKLARQVRVATDPRFAGVGMICGEYDEVDPDGKPVRSRATRTGYPIFTEAGLTLDEIYALHTRIDDMSVHHGILLTKLFHGNCMLPSSTMLRREVFETRGGYKQVVSEEAEAHLRWATGFDVAYIDHPLLAYLVGRPGQATSPLKLEKLVERDLVMRQEYLAEHPEFAQANAALVNEVFSELKARRALFQNLRGDTAAARASLREAAALAPLKGKFAQLAKIYKLPDFAVRAVFGLRGLVKKVRG